MKRSFVAIAITALLTIGTIAHAEDAAPASAAPAASPSEAPVAVPRPSIVAPKTAEPAKASEPAKVSGATPPLADPAPRRHRRHAHRHYRRYAFWSPIPVYWPYIHRHRIYWSRISWFGF
jgi:hypothetical protein